MATPQIHDGIYNAQTPKLQKCQLTTTNGGQYELKNMIVEMSVHEDIYSFCVGGYLMIRDGEGLIELFKFNGGEFIELQFDKMPNSTNPKKYLVYKVGDRRPTGNMNSEFYKLYFCSYDLFYNEQVRVGKFYLGKKIDEIVRDILVNKLGTVRNIEIEPTIGVYDFNHLSMMHPFQAISDISNYARPSNGGVNGVTGADMFLFENNKGYNFKSLQSLMKQTPYATYRYQQNNIDPETKDLALENDSVIAIEFVRSYNILKDVAAGAFANKIIAINPFTKSHEYKIFDYDEYAKMVPPVNGQTIKPNVTTPTGLKPNQTPDGHIKVVLTNSVSKDTKVSANTYIPQDVYMQETLSLRTAQVALANHTILKIVVPGDSNLTVGQTINFNLFSIQMKKERDSRDLDKGYSGKYLITAVRHIIQSQGVHQTVLEIAKNSTQMS
jgi:hypothetical protein